MTTIILGIDGGCFEHLEKLLSNNLVPNFKKILENGTKGPLKDTIPPATIPSWPCLFSGMSPEDLGFYYFMHPVKGLFNSQFWREKSLFNLLDLKTFVLNLPGTYPAWKINGEMISGMLSPDLNCYPPELKFALKKDWIVEAKNIKEVYNAFHMKSDLFLTKMDENYELMVYVIKAPDTISHISHGNTEFAQNQIHQSYIEIDKFLGKILSHKNFENIFIFSDHGLKLYKYELSVCRLLEKKGLLNINWNSKEKLMNIFFKLIDIIRPFLKSNPFSKYYRKKLKKRSRLKKLKNLPKNDQKAKKTRLEYYTANVGGLFLTGDNKRRKSVIINSLKNNKYVKSISVPFLKGFPDLFIILNEKYLFNKNPSYFLKRRRDTLSHKQIGLFIAYGNDIVKKDIDIISFQSVIPTILRLYKKPQPDYMKGEPLNILKSS